MSNRKVQRKLVKYSLMYTLEGILTYLNSLTLVTQNPLSEFKEGQEFQ